MNDYTTMTNRLVTELTTGLAALNYTPLNVQKGIWKVRALEPDSVQRYTVFIAPPTTDPITEVMQGARAYAYILRADIFLLVKNYIEDGTVLGGASVYGDTAPNLGVFEMIKDVKAILRATDLGGLVERTFTETASGSAFETGAATGFDTGEYGWVHRAKLTYRAQMHTVCF